MQNWIEKLQELKYDGGTKNAVQAYKYLIDNFYSDISKTEKYMSLYAQFFRLSRRNKLWRKLYFDFLQGLKDEYHDKTPQISDLKKHLVEFYNIQMAKKLSPKVETSFVSKALHMVNNKLAIWDANIKVSLLGLSKNYDPIKKDFDNAQKVYEQTNDIIQAKIPKDRDIIQIFKQNFPNESKNISDTKILDFYYWKKSV